MSLPTPYYADDLVTLYHADCRVLLPLVEADVVVTDPPYGIGFRSGWTGAGIQGDESTESRDALLREWGDRPAMVFGDAREAAIPGSVATLVWHRPGSGMGDLSIPWKPDHERIHVLGRGWVGTTRGTSVLSVPWDVFRGDALHPHQKPVGLMVRLIERCPPGTILDPYAGSGSTLVAAKSLNRKAIGIEIEERYCEVAADRLRQDVLGLSA